MKIGVAGLWHLGVTYAIGFAELGHDVIAYDPDADSIHGFQSGELRVHEPGLADLLENNAAQMRLNFTNQESDLENIELFVLAYDTPVDDDDNADVDYVMSEFRRIARHLNTETHVMLCAQLPVGTSEIITDFLAETAHRGRVMVQPENLRLGRAIESFFQPGRIIVGTKDGLTDSVAMEAFAGVDAPIQWMHQKSAEVTKHALNAFLATSVTFMGELAEICEFVGANAKEVELGLKSDSRIGPRAYLSPGLGFAGGTLARDVQKLSSLQRQIRKDPAIFTSLLVSNRHNNDWISRSLAKITSEKKGAKICFWGVSYVENTDTLRRSEIYTTMAKLAKENFEVSFVENFPLKGTMEANIRCFNEPNESLEDLDILVVNKRLSKGLHIDLLSGYLEKGRLWILDPSRLLLELNPAFLGNPRYLTEGHGK
jgi:UDPglucose 6-dehydrogenase